MTSEQTDQQVSYKYLFIITPLEIKSNSKIKTNNSKAILIKLANKTAKCTQINTPLELEIDVMYSKTLQKYCPIKGIIKIYDISQDGSQIISCVGGFQTDQLLNEGKNNVVIQKQLGTSKLKMDINIINKTEKKVEQKSSSQAYTRERESNSRQKYLLSQKSPKNTPVVPLPSTNMKPTTGIQIRKNNLISNQSYKSIEAPFKSTSKNINKSIEKINEALNFRKIEQNSISNKANEVLGKAEFETLKQNLSDQKRRYLMVEQRLNKANSKLASNKIFFQKFKTQSQTYYQIFKKIIAELQVKEGKIELKLFENNKTVVLNYKDKNIEKTLKDFIQIAFKKVSNYIPITDIDFDNPDKQRNSQEFEQCRKQVAILKKLTMQKDKKIYSLQKQLEGIEVTINNLKQTNKNLNEQNSYLRQKNDQIYQMQITLDHKEAIIENMRKDIQKYCYENQQLDNKLYNMTLQVQELKEEVSNGNQIIEQYRSKYGDLKNVKNRAIQMEIKECIRWIDQQNRDLQMSQMEQTMHSEQKDEKDDSLSSVIRNIQIQKVPVEQISIIRDELVRILKKIDNFMSK